MRWNSPYINHFISPDPLVPSTEKGFDPSLVVNYSENSFLEQLNKTNAQSIKELTGQKQNLRQQISPDPKGFDRYSYANNNPIRFSDPSGHCVWDLCIVEIGFVSIGLVEFAAAGGTVALTTYVYGPNGQEHVDELTDSIINLGESAAEDLASLVKGEYIPPGLIGAERDAYREALHRYKDAWGLGAKDNVPKDILDQLAKKIKDGYDPEDAADDVDSPPEADDSE